MQTKDVKRARILYVIVKLICVHIASKVVNILCYLEYPSKLRNAVEDLPWVMKSPLKDFVKYEPFSYERG